MITMDDKWGDQMSWMPGNVLSYEEALKEGETRIMLIGPRRSGKSSIERVVFHKMSPHETLFLESTHSVDINWIANNNFVRFQTWDFGGDLSLHHDVMYQGRKISPETILRNTSTLVYVIDAQEEDYEDSLPKLVETISAAHSINPQIHFEVFLVSYALSAFPILTRSLITLAM
jgi:Ras-related GTP-binding protein C/D